MKLKNITALVLCAAFMLTFTACQKEEEIAENVADETNTTTVMGQVTEIIGNEITIQLASSQENENMPSMMNNRGEMTDEEKAAMEEARENGEMPENVKGNMSGMMGNREEMTDEEKAAFEENRGNGEMPNMGQRGEGMAEGEMPDMSQRGQGMNRESMVGGMMGGSMNIVLSDETASYTIPVGATVYVNGSESTFSYITEESYVTILLDENGTIIEISTMG